MTRHRRLLGLGVGVLAVAAWVGYPTADPPDPHDGSTLPVREQNVDGNGWIAVHEQGESDVHVTNGSLQVSGEVTVGNFPQTLQITVPPASTAGFGGGAEPSEEVIFNFATTVNATAIALWDSSLTGDNNPEFRLKILSPLAQGSFLFQYSYDDGLDSHDIRSFSQPIPISGLQFLCRNESNLCTVGITVIGTPAS